MAKERKSREKSRAASRRAKTEQPGRFREIAGLHLALVGLDELGVKTALDTLYAGVVTPGELAHVNPGKQGDFARVTNEIFGTKEVRDALRNVMRVAENTTLPDQMRGKAAGILHVFKGRMGDFPTAIMLNRAEPLGGAYKNTIIQMDCPNYGETGHYSALLFVPVPSSNPERPFDLRFVPTRMTVVDVDMSSRDAVRCTYSVEIMTSIPVDIYAAEAMTRATLSHHQTYRQVESHALRNATFCERGRMEQFAKVLAGMPDRSLRTAKSLDAVRKSNSKLGHVTWRRIAQLAIESAVAENYMLQFADAYGSAYYQSSLVPEDRHIVVKVENREELHRYATQHIASLIEGQSLVVRQGRMLTKGVVGISGKKLPRTLPPATKAGRLDRARRPARRDHGRGGR